MTSPRLQTITATLGACALLGGLASGCGSSSKSSSTGASAAATPSTTATAPATSTPTAGSTSTGAASPATNPKLAHKPTIARQRGPAPSTLKVKDIVRGTGAAAQVGQTVTVQYVGVLYRTGKQFDASWDRGQPISFQLAPGQLIQGWIQGVPGMRVGGRRELIVPAALGYGAQGQPPVIPPNAPLVFVIDLLGVQ